MEKLRITARRPPVDIERGGKLATSFSMSDRANIEPILKVLLRQIECNGTSPLRTSSPCCKTSGINVIEQNQDCQPYLRRVVEK